MNLPDSEETVAAVAEVLRRAASMSAHHDEFDAEIRDIADRFGIDAPVAPVAPEVTAIPPAPEVLDVGVERHYIPDRLPPGERVTCNVRFRNQGTESFSSASATPITVGVRWFDGDGRLVPLPEHRTRFPITMTPGRAVTLPVELDTPAREGVYSLVVCPVIEHRRWVFESGFAASVTVQSGSVRHALDLQPDAQALPYAEDHEVARLMLEQQAAGLLAVPGRRILEIGVGAAPQVSWFGPHDAVNVDINLPLLELGSLWYDHHADEVTDRVAFLCADATDLPFESETFDIVAMFATLHHFPQPEVLLRECRRLLRPKGLLAVMCEPVGASLESIDTLRDLEKGINEQVFTAAEYEAIFAAAGLAPVAGNQVGGSLRALLTRAAGSDRSFTPVAPIPPSLLDQLRPAQAPAEDAQPVRVDEPGPRSSLRRKWVALGRRVRARL